MAKPPGSIFNGAQLGYFPWAPADFGEQSIVKSFPAAYKLDKKGQPNDFMKAYLAMAKHAMNSVKESIDGLDDQIDPQTVRSDILRFLGSTIAVELDDYEPQEYQRSLVANAVQFYRIKGTKDSYRIRGKISGYDVQVTNIYRIDPDMPLDTVEGASLAVGTGSGFLIVSGKLPSTPLVATTLDILVSGTVVAQDTGAGTIVAAPGGPYAVTGTVDGDTGSYSFTITPSPAVGALITANYATAFQDTVLKDTVGAPLQGDGTANQLFTASLQSYPPIKGSIVILLDGVPLAEDNALGAFLPAPGSPYTSGGSINYETGLINLNVVQALPVGARLGVSFTKTLRGEMLQRYPEDIYEIPGDSNNWYSTVEPNIIAGGPKVEGCGYCKTSFIRVLFTLVKPLGTAIPSSSENFFDRLVRKLKDITPIHVRDILYELRFTIVIDESENIGAEMDAQEEISWVPTPAFDRFDAIACDSIPLDRRGYVIGTVTLE